MIATVLGTLMALALVRYQFRGRAATNLFIFIPLATPEVVLGASLLSLFISIGFARGFTTILIAHVMFSVSFVVVTVRSRLIGFDRSIEEAAQDLGANGLQTFLRVTLPLIAPGVLAAALLTFALSVDDFVITNFNSGSTITYPLYIWGAARVSIPPQVNVLATMIFLFTVAVMLLTVWQQRRAERLASVRPRVRGTEMEAAAAGTQRARPEEGRDRLPGRADHRDRLHGARLLAGRGAGDRGGRAWACRRRRCCSRRSSRCS